MYDVITVGSSTIDTFAKVQSELVKIRTLEHTEELIAYPSGSKILINDLTFMSGGGGTNTAVAFSKLGLKVAYLGKIGDDNNSSLILKELKKEKVDFIGKKAHGISGYSIILDSLEGDRTILAYKGVNDSLDFKEIALKKLKTKWFYFSSMVRKSYETLEKIAKYAQEKDIKIAFNPSNYLAEKGKLYLREILSRTTLLVLNKEEAALIVGKGEISDLILRLLELGPKIVVITDGKRGAYTVVKNKLFHIKPREVNSVETTGAGDAFASTFLAGMIKSKDTETCLKMGSANAECVIRDKGAKKGLQTYKMLLSYMRKNKNSVKKVTI